MTATVPLTRSSEAPDLHVLARRQKRRRAVPLLVVALLLFVTSFVVFLALEPKPGGRDVLSLSRDVVAGHPLDASDLAVIRVQAGTLPLIGVGDRSTLVGKALGVSLPAGTLLSSKMFVGQVGPQSGQAIVGADLKTGAFPPGLTPGALVEVFAGGPDPIATASVYALSEPDASQTDTVVSLVVPAKVAGQITTASAAGTASLVWVTP